MSHGAYIILAYSR